MADKSRTEVSPSTVTQAENAALQPTTYCRTTILSCGRVSNSIMQGQPLTSSFAGNEKSYQNELLSFSFNLMLCNSRGQAM